MSRFLRNKGIRTILTSPLKRALNTSTVISDTINCNIEVVDFISERSAGIYEGVLFSSIDKENSLFTRPADKITNGESYEDLVNRVNQLKTYLEKFDNDDVIAIVTHGWFINALLNELLGICSSKFPVFNNDFLGVSSLLLVDNQLKKVQYLNNREFLRNECNT